MCDGRMMKFLNELRQNFFPTSKLCKDADVCVPTSLPASSIRLG